VNEEPSQLPVVPVGVTKYVAVCVILEVLSNVPLINGLPLSEAPPDKEAVMLGTPHLYEISTGTIPLVRLVGETTNVPPLHITVLIAVISGFGFTNTVNVNGLLGHDGVVVGITVNVAVCKLFVPL
jgi:hypothetical protein